MAEQPPESDVSDITAFQHALVSLHALAGNFEGRKPDVIPGFRPSSPGTDLRAVAEAPEELVPVSARLAVLYELAAANFPHRDAFGDEYLALAQSVASRRGLQPDQLLSDLAQSATARTPFSRTDSAQKLDHHETAFIGEDVCTVRRVKIGGIDATWIFSEFETDASFEHVAEWVDPRNWTHRTPMLFKRMEIPGQGGPVNITPGGDQHWHSVFHEEVQLARAVNTLLHCDFRLDSGQTAGMTYELAFSLDNQINVDRGFLLVNEAGDVRRVQALKIVGFTVNQWNDVAQFVCPFWTDWVRQAVRGGKNSAPKAPTHTPPGQTGPSPLEETFAAWAAFLGQSASTYLQLFEDVSSRVRSDQYSAGDLVDDGRRYWSQLAKDWAGAWKHGLQTLDEIAEEGLDAGFTPPGVAHDVGRGAARMATAGAPAGTAEPEGTVIPIPGLPESSRPAVTDLVSIEAGGATIAAADITVTVQALDDGTPAVHLRTTNSSVPSGLYVGQLESPAGTALAPAQLYISRATEA